VEKKMMKQAAMYVRVSSQQQKEESTIESQKAVLLQYAKEKGFEIAPSLFFEDNGISGSTLIRPGLEKLRDFASEGLFNHVFILSPDRLSRKFAHQAVLLEEFNRNNIKVNFYNSPDPKTPADNLLLQIQGMFVGMSELKLLNVLVEEKNIKQKMAVLVFYLTLHMVIGI
jgi:site-specific DNA recombinase